MLPDIYFFNPTCELAIANGSPYYTAPARLRKFEEELAFLPAWLGRECDQVLVRGDVDILFMERMERLGFKLATPIGMTDALADPVWLSQPKGMLVPWGWSPALYHLFKPVMPTFCEDFLHSSVGKWMLGHKNLYSRLSGIALLSKIVGNAMCTWIPVHSEIPVVGDTLAKIYREIERHTKAVVKSPWSSSGRGLLLFPNPDQQKKNEEVLSGMLNQQGFVTVEPWLEKVMDLSYQFQSNGGKISYKGRTIFETDQKGRYLRNFLHDSPKFSAEINVFLAEHHSEVISLLNEALSVSGYASQYEGWIGVDALIYRTVEGNLKFHPMVEINGRFTMGAIALKVRSHLADRSQGFMQIFYSKKSSFYDFCKGKEIEMPLIMKNHKIVSGFLPLTPPHKEHHFGAFVEVMSDEL